MRRRRSPRATRSPIPKPSTRSPRWRPHRSTWSGDLLDRPAVAVGVGEEDEFAPGELLDVAELDTAPCELGSGVVGIVHDELQALHRARRRVNEALPQRDRA